MNSSNNPTTPRWRLRLIGITIGVVAAALIAPTTGWLMRLEAYNAVPHNNAEYQYNPNYITGPRPIPASVSRDFDVQLAQAVLRGTQLNESGQGSIDGVWMDSRTMAVLGLASRYPHEAAVYGTAILYALMGSVRCNRLVDEKPLAYTAGGADGYTNYPQGSPLPALTAYDKDCAAGERADPNNAYFPAFRAYGLFAQHRDREAIGELIAAGNKPYYKEYYMDEADGRLKIAEATEGGKEALTRVMVRSSELFPHFAYLRDMVRLAVAMAIVREEHGDIATGFKLRRAVRRLGGLMRYGGTTVITNLVGVAIVNIAATKPDGIVPPGYAALDDSEGTTGHAPNNNTRQNFYNSMIGGVNRKLQARMDTYVVYLKRIGHTEEASAYLAEHKADVQVMSIGGDGFDLGDYMPMAIRVGDLWAASYVLLWNAVAILCFGLVAWALSRLPAIKSANGITSASVRGVIAFGATISIAALVVWCLASYVGPFNVSFIDLPITNGELALLTTILCAVVVITPVVLARQPIRAKIAGAAGSATRGAKAAAGAINRPGLRAAVFHAGLCVSAIAALCLALAWIAKCLSSAAYGALWITHIFDFNEYIRKPTDFDPIWLVAILALLMAVMATALLTRRGRAATVAIVHTLRAGAVPLACLLLIAYAGLVCCTVREESMAVQKLNDNMGNEGRYFATLLHREWPGPPGG